MRHRSTKKILKRKAGPRRALFKTLAASLLVYEKVRTTEAKAKAIRPIVERLITAGKPKTLNAKRHLASRLSDKKAVKKILEVYADHYKDRPGGYTRIIKLGRRRGDNAPVVQIEMVK